MLWVSSCFFVVTTRCYRSAYRDGGGGGGGGGDGGGGGVFVSLAFRSVRRRGVVLSFVDTYRRVMIYFVYTMVCFN